MAYRVSGDGGQTWVYCDTAGTVPGTTAYTPDAAGRLTVTNPLILSQYIEGSGLNKGVEIFNASAVPVDLAALGCGLRVYVNGEPFTVGGVTLRPGESHLFAVNLGLNGTNKFELALLTTPAATWTASIMQAYLRVGDGPKGHQDLAIEADLWTDSWIALDATANRGVVAVEHGDTNRESGYRGYGDGCALSGGTGFGAEGYPCQDDDACVSGACTDDVCAAP